MPRAVGFTHESPMAILTPTSEDLRIYEIAILYPHNISQKEETEILKDIEKILKGAGNELAKDLWGRRGLAYTIEGHDEGRYAIYHYELDPAKIDEIDEELRLLPGVLRHLIIKPPKDYEVVKFSEEYEKWLKTREQEEEMREKKKEEDLKKKVVERAKRQVKKVEKKEEAAAPAMEEEKIDAEIDKLISDDDLEI